MALKINPQKYNWPQKTCKLLKNKFPGSNWRVILMRIKQSEVFDKVSVTEICVFLTRPGTVTDFWFFWRVKKYFKKKITTRFYAYHRLSLGRIWKILIFHHVPRLAQCYVSVKSKLQHPPPRAYPGHLTPFLAREGENLITNHRGWGIWSLASMSWYGSHWFHVGWRMS